LAIRPQAGEVDASYRLRLRGPAAGTFVLGRLHRAGAGEAADRPVAEGDQWIPAQTVRTQVIGDFPAGPGGERVDADARADRLERRERGAARRLVALAPGEPGTIGLDGAGHR